MKTTGRVSWRSSQWPIGSMARGECADLELRYDEPTRTHVVVLVNANPSDEYAPPRGVLLPARAGQGENRGFAFRVTEHAGGHRLQKWKLFVAAGLAYGLGVGFWLRARRRPSARAAHVMATLGLVLAAVLFVFAWR